MSPNTEWNFDEDNQLIGIRGYVRYGKISQLSFITFQPANEICKKAEVTLPPKEEEPVVEESVVEESEPEEIDPDELKERSKETEIIETTDTDDNCNVKEGESVKDDCKSEEEEEDDSINILKDFNLDTLRANLDIVLIVLVVIAVVLFIIICICCCCCEEKENKKLKSRKKFQYFDYEEGQHTDSSPTRA